MTNPRPSDLGPYDRIPDAMIQDPGALQEQEVAPPVTSEHLTTLRQQISDFVGRNFNLSGFSSSRIEDDTPDVPAPDYLPPNSPFADRVAKFIAERL